MGRDQSACQGGMAETENRDAPQSPFCGDGLGDFPRKMVVRTQRHQPVCRNRRFGDCAYRTHITADSLHLAEGVHPRLYARRDNGAGLRQHP